MTTLSIPGNLLLAGEYAVLEEGGLGLAVAVPPRVFVRVSKPPNLKGLRFHGLTAGGAVCFGLTGAEGQFHDFSHRLVAAALRPAAPAPPAAHTDVPPGLIEVDSRALYRPDGQKSGRGSSAALAVAVTAAVGELAGRSYRGRLDALMRRAVEVHRTAQDGRGSGYDVATSVFGGTILFVGGKSPGVYRLGPAALWDARLVFGEASVSTRDAVARYGAWKEQNPGAAAAFLTESNRAVLELSRALDEGRHQFAAALRRAAAIGSRVGQAIGVPVSQDRWTGSNAPFEAVKALGAGGEIGIALTDAGESVQTAYEGVRWN